MRAARHAARVRLRRHHAAHREGGEHAREEGVVLLDAAIRLDVFLPVMAEQRLIELIKERNQAPENSQRYNDLQNTIEFTMQHMGITEEPTVPSDNTPSAPKTRGQSQHPQQDSARQTTADRRERIRQIEVRAFEKLQKSYNAWGNFLMETWC